MQACINIVQTEYLQTPKVDCNMQYQSLGLCLINQHGWSNSYNFIMLSCLILFMKEFSMTWCYKLHVSDYLLASIISMLMGLGLSVSLTQPDQVRRRTRSAFKFGSLRHWIGPCHAFSIPLFFSSRSSFHVVLESDLQVYDPLTFIDFEKFLYLVELHLECFHSV